MEGNNMRVKMFFSFVFGFAVATLYNVSVVFGSSVGVADISAVSSIILTIFPLLMLFLYIFLSRNSI